jgi:hypothetical protein
MLWKNSRNNVNKMGDERNGASFVQILSQLVKPYPHAISGKTAKNPYSVTLPELSTYPQG